jgi:hypothetical protein
MKEAKKWSERTRSDVVDRSAVVDTSSEDLLAVGRPSEVVDLLAGHAPARGKDQMEGC